MPAYISRNPAFQYLTNPLTPFDHNYSTLNAHLLATFPRSVQASPYATWEGMLDLPLNENNPTPLPTLIEERLTNSLIRLASTQLELTQELTTLEFYHLLHFPSPLSNLNTHHLYLIHQLNNFVHSSLQQILNMQSPNHPDEEFMDNEEDANMEDQVVPEIPMSQPSPTIHQHQPPPQREEEPDTLEPLAQTLYLRNPLTLDMLLNIEKKFLINVPQEVTKADLNIRCYNSQQPLKYVALVIPIIENKQTLEMENTEEMQATVNLEMALTPGGSSNSPESPLMKIFLWSCRGANNAKFMNNIRALIDSHNPTILALTETRMEDHDKILQALDYTDVIQVPTFGILEGLHYSRGTRKSMWSHS
ncbi:hypothetical protein KY289_013439 [Solanum tuberosum]|nr:hypothetical protein KY289_013439 [Solanum tuberosum]